MAIETVAMADVSTADVATFNDCERSVLGSDGNAGSWKLETHAALSDPGGHEHVLLNMARLSRIFPMAREDLSAMERGSCNAMFQRSQGVKFAVPEHQRRARPAVSEAVLEPSARILSSTGNPVMLEL